MKAAEELTGIAKLLARMDKAPGFAGLGGSIQTICRLADDVDSGTREIADAVLQDAGLTSQLLRIANSSAHAGRGRAVSTVNQAIAILGLNTVKSVALSVALLSSISNKAQADRLQAEIVAANFCGALAHTVTRLNGARYSAQEAHVCGLMQNLGRLMATYFLFDDIERSRQLQAEKNISEDEAVLATLGVGYNDISIAIARHWNLPDVLQLSLTTDVGKTPPRSATNAAGWHQFCSMFSRRITDTLFRLPEPRERSELAHITEFFRSALQVSGDDVQEWIEQSLTNTDALLTALSFPCNVEQARITLRKASERVMDLLESKDSLTRSSGTLMGKSPIEVIQPVLRQIHDHYNFDRTLLCLMDGPNRLVAVAGVGRNAGSIVTRFRCHGTQSDIFRMILARKTDMFIANVKTTPYAHMIPDWFHEFVGALAFQVLVLSNGGDVLGMVYGDYSEPPAHAPTSTQLGPVKEWCDQMVRALKSGVPVFG